MMACIFSFLLGGFLATIFMALFMMAREDEKDDTDRRL